MGIKPARSIMPVSIIKILAAMTDSIYSLNPKQLLALPAKNELK